jgi:hypothetical protein
MTSSNTESKAPRKPGPWEALLMLIIVLAVVLGFIAALVALFKWA